VLVETIQTKQLSKADLLQLFSSHFAENYGCGRSLYITENKFRSEGNFFNRCLLFKPVYEYIDTESL
jgi:hypothetical protein